MNPVAPMPVLPLVAPIVIEPSPVPVQVAIGDRKLPKGRAIVIQMATPLGVNIFHLSEDGARDMRDMLDRALGGIAIVRPDQMPTK